MAPGGSGAGWMGQGPGVCPASALQKGVDLTFRIAPGGTHSEASWERQIPVFMKCLGF